MRSNSACFSLVPCFFHPEIFIYLGNYDRIWDPGARDGIVRNFPQKNCDLIGWEPAFVLCRKECSGKTYVSTVRVWQMMTSPDKKEKQPTQQHVASTAI